MSRKRQGERLPPAETDPETGRKICRHPECSQLVEPPRRSWCGQACVDDWLIRNNPSHARHAVMRRDKGVCLICRRDCDAIKKEIRRLRTIKSEGFWAYKKLRTMADEHYGDQWPPKIEERLKRLAAARLKRILDDLVREGFDRRRSSYWDMDHIKPVEQGGGLCGLDNLQTLCQPCHKAKTARQAAERAAARKKS